MIRTAAVLVLLLAAAGAVPHYFASGFTHIVPYGLDHVLFILGLFFLNRNFAVLLFQMTLFTIAHSLTLGLALYGLVSLPSSFVEIAIAASISFVAIENLLVKDRLSAWRPWVVFASGLVHGLGFAHIFSVSPPPVSQFLPALFSFNLGIEFGQLAVIIPAWLITSAFRDPEKYRKMIVTPGCVMLGFIGLALAVSRFAQL